VMTEWGYSNDSGETETDPDISATYGKPMLQWLEALGGSWTAWGASNSWLPKMFTDNWTLRVGPLGAQSSELANSVGSAEVAESPAPTTVTEPKEDEVGTQDP
jgi:hypothetical protein